MMIDNLQSNAAPDSIDQETRVNQKDHQALRLWLRLLTCTNTVEAQIRSRLRVEFDTTLPRFDLMAQLERNPAGLNMRELSNRLMVTGGNVTGITEQLRNEGLVTRESDLNDRRNNTVKLTPSGKKLFAKMARAHEQWVIELFAGLAPTEQEQCYLLLAQLKAHMLQMELTVSEDKGDSK